MSTPVAIAGAGPVGILVALELARHGVSSVLADRSPEPTRFPKMDITNGRSMELFRRLGFADELRTRGVAAHHSFDVHWASADGRAPFGRWNLPSVDEQRARIAARNDGTQPQEADQRVPQSAFETLGRELCRAEPLIELREGQSFVSCTQDESGVDIVLADAAGVETALRASYLVGADGAGSRVRRQLGIALADDGGMPRNYMIHFRSTDLATLHRDGPFWHRFVMGSVIIAQDERDTWTFHAPLFDELPDGAEPDAAEFLAQRTGLAVRIDEVLLTSVWQPRFALADSYRSGRVFLAGDAAHQVFPTGGYGMNTGVGDAIDLGWKLAAAVNGWGGPVLLDSYEAERRPVGATNLHYARRHLGIHRAVVERTMAGADAAELRTFVEDNRGENEFDGVEFGYRYTGSPVVVPDGSAEPEWRETDYVPGTWPGARPPSLTLDDGSSLFDRLGPAFTLVDFRGNGGGLASTARDLGIPTEHLPVTDPLARRVWERDLVLVRPDQHVAWRCDDLPDDDTWRAVLDQVSGQPGPTA